MLPLVQPDGLPLPARLTVLAMHAGCKAPTAAFALVRHPMSEPVQTALAHRFGNVPALASAALAEQLCRVHPAGAAYRRMLASSTCLWSDEALSTLSRCATLTFHTEGGTPSVEAAAKRLEFSLSIGIGERLVLR